MVRAKYAKKKRKKGSKLAVRYLCDGAPGGGCSVGG